MKANPTLADPQKIQLDPEQLNHLSQAISSDENDLAYWHRHQYEAYRRRYSQLNRAGVKTPWVGASAVNIPMSSMKVDELKGPLANVALPSRRLVTFAARDEASERNAQMAARTMDWLLRRRMTDYGNPDYEKQVLLDLDSALQYGVHYNKQFYCFRSIPRRYAVRRAEMPEALMRIQVVPQVNPATQQEMASQGVFLFTPEQYDQIARPEVERIIRFEYGLDMAEREDRDALRRLIDLHRNGKPDSKRTITTRQVLDDGPRTINVAVGDILFPVGARSLASSPRITHDLWLSAEEILGMRDDAGWDEEAVDQILDRGPVTVSDRGSGKTQETYQAMRARTQTYTEGRGSVYRVSETYFYKKVDGCPRLCVQWWDRRRTTTRSDESAYALLRCQEYPNAHGTMPLTETKLEVNEDFVLGSRGVPELLRDLERYVTSMTRHQMNGLSLTTAPVYEYVLNAGFNPQKHRITPGTFLPARRPNTVRQVTQAPTSLALDSPIQQFQAMGDRVTGSFLSNSLRGSRERVTKGEVDAVGAREVATIGLRHRALSMGRVPIYRQLWSDWRQFGPASFYVQATGQPVEYVTQHKIAGNYDIVPAATIDDMDPDHRARMALSMLDSMLKVQPFLAQDERFVLDFGAAQKAYLDEIDPTMSARFMRYRTPEEIERFRQAQQQALQKAQVIEEEGRRLIEGAAVDPERQTELLRQINKRAANKDLQQVVHDAAAVQQQAAAQIGAGA